MLKSAARALRAGASRRLLECWLHRVLERSAAGARRVHQHRHVAGRMLVLPHDLMRRRDLVPGEDLAQAGIDSTVEHKLICGARLLEMREMRALNALLAHPHIARIEGEIVAARAGAEDHHA